MSADAPPRYRNWNGLRSALHLLVFFEVVALLVGGWIVFDRNTETDGEREEAYEQIEADLSQVCDGVGVATAGERSTTGAQRRAWYSGMPEKFIEGPSDLASYDTVVCLATSVASTESCEYYNPDEPGKIYTYSTHTYNVNGVVRDARSALEVSSFFTTATTSCRATIPASGNLDAEINDLEWPPIVSLVEQDGHLAK